MSLKQSHQQDKRGFDAYWQLWEIDADKFTQSTEPTLNRVKKSELKHSEIHEGFEITPFRA